LCAVEVTAGICVTFLVVVVVGDVVVVVVLFSFDVVVGFIALLLFVVA